ncbi:MAG: hypothetical protein M1120_02065 [Patescibacteria group bacterium]|nr:hypothetical protein [Patescibacteria group bacterium]
MRKRKIADKRRASEMTPLKSLLTNFDFDRDRFISREWQKYAYDLAQSLNDIKHKSLYMRLAKTTPRVLLEKSKNFVADASSVKSKARLFMWKLGQLKKEYELKSKIKNQSSK